MPDKPFTIEQPAAPTTAPELPGGQRTPDVFRRDLGITPPDSDGHIPWGPAKQDEPPFKLD